MTRIVDRPPVNPDAASLHATTRRADRTPAGPPTVIDVRELLGGRATVVLALDGEPYVLRLTKNCRLILTK